MDGRFEWHITLDKEHRLTAQAVAKKFGWTFSEITGCPILGQGTYCYITGYQTFSGSAKFDLDVVCDELKSLGVPVLRAKIEDIVYDTKTNVNRI